jgi:hypothetical protein
MKTRSALLLEPLTAELGAAGPIGAGRPHTPQGSADDFDGYTPVVTVDDVTALLAALHEAEAIEQALNDRRARLDHDPAR